MHFCGKMTVNYLRKGIKKNVKDLVLLANQIYETKANMNVVKNRMGI